MKSHVVTAAFLFVALASADITPLPHSRPKAPIAARDSGLNKKLFQRQSCPTLSKVCDDIYCINSLRVCCGDGDGTNCNMGTYCIPEGCCAIGKICTGEATCKSRSNPACPGSRDCCPSDMPHCVRDSKGMALCTDDPSTYTSVDEGSGSGGNSSGGNSSGGGSSGGGSSDDGSSGGGSSSSDDEPVSDADPTPDTNPRPTQTRPTEEDINTIIDGLRTRLPTGTSVSDILDKAKDIANENNDNNESGAGKVGIAIAAGLLGGAGLVLGM